MKKYLQRNVVWALSVIAVIAVSILTVLGQSVPQPVLSISSLGTNQFLIGITNAVTNAAYELHWRPALNNTNYPWQVIATNQIGQTNFSVDAGLWDFGYFRVSAGADADGDGVPDWADAAPDNPTLGILTLTIDSPVNGAVFQ